MTSLEISATASAWSASLQSTATVLRSPSTLRIVTRLHSARGSPDARHHHRHRHRGLHLLPGPASAAALHHRRERRFGVLGFFQGGAVWWGWRHKILRKIREKKGDEENGVRKRPDTTPKATAEAPAVARAAMAAEFGDGGRRSRANAKPERNTGDRGHERAHSSQPHNRRNCPPERHRCPSADPARADDEAGPRWRDAEHNRGRRALERAARGRAKSMS
ncbi:MAG: hypothetical protein M1832_002761 [Thelocarpon impressellum]|nr:MAG: hypothetical protein M1832_002761 [Thelocarpon impressellum]